MPPLERMFDHYPHHDPMQLFIVQSYPFPLLCSVCAVRGRLMHQLNLNMIPSFIRSHYHQVANYQVLVLKMFSLARVYLVINCAG
jgi:hypothetical protein